MYPGEDISRPTASQGGRLALTRLANSAYFLMQEFLLTTRPAAAGDFIYARRIQSHRRRPAHSRTFGFVSKVSAGKIQKPRSARRPEPDCARSRRQEIGRASCRERV